MSDNKNSEILKALRTLEEWSHSHHKGARRCPEAWEPSVNQHAADAMISVAGVDSLLAVASLLRAAAWVLIREERDDSESALLLPGVPW